MTKTRSASISYGSFVKLLIAASAVFYTAAGLAESITIAGHQITLLQPPGSCWLPESGPAGELVAQSRAISTKQGIELIAMFADCGEIKAVQSKKATTLQRQGNLSVLMNRGLPILTNQSSEKFAESTAAELSKSIGLNERQLSDNRDYVNRVVPGTVIDFRLPRLIGKDRSAAYILSITLSRTAKGQDRNIANLSAFTVLRGVQVMVTTHWEVKGEPYDYLEQLTMQKKLLAELVSVNS